MNQRLEAICRLIRPGIGLIDVGTDHGYLPERLALSGYPGRIIASDLREGPLAAARRTAATSGVSERIEFTLSDGLDACPPDAVDTIVIAGMGGDTICGILDRAEWCMDPAYQLILQPMTKAEVLRYWLSNNGFLISNEILVEDAGTVYQIIVSEFRNENECLSDAELYLGKRGLADRKLYRWLICDRLRRLETRIAGLQRAASSETGLEKARLEEEMEQLRQLLGGVHE